MLCPLGIYQGCMQGVVVAPKRANLKKIKKKKAKKEQNQEINQNDHNAVHKWVKTNEFLRGGGNPLHPQCY